MNDGAMLPSLRTLSKWVRQGILGLCLSLIWVFATPILQPQAIAFVLDDWLTNGTPADYSDDLLDAARWTNQPESLVTDGIRGLGGGLEYAIAPTFCTALVPRFIDTPAPTCDQLRQEIQSAFDQWAMDHPILNFVEISSTTTAQLPPPRIPDPWRGFGAEIDVFALTAQEYPQVAPYGAYTTFWVTNQTPIGTNKQPLSGRTITSADIVFNASACYHFNPQFAGRNCNHFSSLMLHEIGHALSLDHPNEYPQRNFDTDSEPGNSIPISCDNPTTGLMLSAAIAPEAIMNSSLGNAANVQPTLSADDRGGRDFLYPICTIGVTVPSSGFDPIRAFIVSVVYMVVLGAIALVLFPRVKRRR